MSLNNQLCCQSSDEMVMDAVMYGKATRTLSEKPPETIFVEVFESIKDSSVKFFGGCHNDISVFATSTTPKTVCEYKLVGRREVKLPIEVKEI